MPCWEKSIGPTSFLANGHKDLLEKTMERTTLEVIALTVEDAIAQGLAQLGMSADDVEVEVLDSGGKGLFGIGGRQARVRLTVKDLSARSGLEETGTASATVGEGEDHLLAYARQTVLELVTKMKVDARVTARYGEPDVDGNASVYIDVRGDDLSVLIGRRSETLNALQYIAGLIVSKEAERWVQLALAANVNCGSWPIAWPSKRSRPGAARCSSRCLLQNGVSYISSCATIRMSPPKVSARSRRARSPSCPRKIN
jgi:predicted RNA-binding protein Jag